MKTELKNYIIDNKLLAGCSKLLIAVSGGPDSLAMLDLFFELKEELKIEIGAAHLDHMFRKESKAEADFVENFAFNKGIKFFSKRINLPEYITDNKLSPEAASRKLRFEFFAKIMKNHQFDLLALAHHRDDQVETVLLNLFRGSGLKGLSGIQAQSKINNINIIHPMLNFTKKDILTYCTENKLKPRFDSSNQENIYSRNIIRNKIIPVVEKEINENAREVIFRSSKLITDENKFLQQLAKKYYKKIVKIENVNKITINYNKFKTFDQVLQRRIYRLIYEKLNNNLNDFYLDHIYEIEKLISDSQTGRGIDISSEIRVELSYNDLIFFKKQKRKVKNINQIKLKINGITKIDKKRSLKTKIVERENFEFSNSSRQAAFDYNKIKLPLTLRNRKPGDKLKPLGMSGHKKVKDILIDKKIPQNERENIILVEDAADNIIWLVPYKISEEHKITPKTNKVLILKLEYSFE